MIKTAVILAAGLGSRLKEVTASMPKGFISIGGLPIVEVSLRALIDSGIEKIFIGTGYQAAHYERLAQRYHPAITCVENPDFAKTGSMATLYNIAPSIGVDFLLLESDLVYDPAGLDALISDEKHSGIILASGMTGSGDEVFIETGDSGRLVKLSKNAGELARSDAELVGICRISRGALDEMCRYYEKEREKRPGIDYESVLAGIASAGSDIFVKKIEDFSWCEIDDDGHLHRAAGVIFPKIREKIRARSKSISNISRNILLNPGPATTTDTVKKAMVAPDICPREDEFKRLMARIRRDLVLAAGADCRNYTAVLFAGSGTAAMDSAINSAVAPGGSIAVIVNGAYGERMCDIARAYGIGCLKIDFGPGGKIVPARVKEQIARYNEESLKTGRGALSCLAVIHHETTTGILNPIEAIGSIAKEYGLTYIVDAISSYAGMPIDIEKTGIDFMLSTSNKCIQGMAGAAFVICARPALEKIKDYPKRSYYLDLYGQYKYFEEKGETRFTPPVQVLYALKQAIEEYFTEGGAAARYARYSQSWRVLRAGLVRLGFRLFHEETDESRILLTVYEPSDPRYDFDNMHDFLYERGFTIYPGKIGKTKTFRLANMGAIDKDDIADFILVLGEYLKKSGIEKF